ncbi:MAG TPA: winged helix DNA-binding domain-containing protein [Solirubrobacteraceae bacterium]|nr:winged helix DNA-binding domain-containing protein [Solirubrobacteraceae bacterium]
MRAAVLTDADLGRATLARQMLLERSSCGVVEAVERLAGMQAQEPKHPFVGLWTRLYRFDEADLRAALQERALVRAPLMRSTLHLMSAADYAALRVALQPPLSVALRVLGARAAGLDLDLVLPAARRLLKGAALTFDEIRARLQEQFYAVNDRALGYAVRTLVPLVMVPDEGARWGFGRSVPFTLAGEWLDEPLVEDVDRAARALVRRYLGAFGPASAKDVQAWSGAGGMAAVLDAMRSELEVFSDEGGRRELFDLPGAPRPGADVDAPPRLLPEFDNLVLAWDDRSRVITDEHRPCVTTKNLRVRATFLVDGAVAGTWTIAVKRRVATLALEPFDARAVPKRARGDLQDEAERLVRLIEPQARDHVVVLDPA